MTIEEFYIAGQNNILSVLLNKIRIEKGIEMWLVTDEYTSNIELIRLEYHHLIEEEWEQGRMIWLRKFLGRKKIFVTDTFGGYAESKARKNLETEYETLKRRAKNG